MVTAKQARLTSVVVLLIVFVVGALSGAATIRVVAGDDTPERPRGARPERPNLFETLQLTPEQKTQVDAIMERRRAEMDSFWKQHGPALRALTDSARAEIRTVLTPEQRELEEKFRAERREHMRKHGGSRGRE